MERFNFINCFCLIITFLLITPKNWAQARLSKMYISTGWNYSNQSPDTFNLIKFVDRTHNVNSVYANIGYSFEINRLSYLSVEMQYAQKGYKHLEIHDAGNNFAFQYRYNINYFEVPVYYNFKIFKKLSLNAGLIYAHTIACTVSELFKGDFGGTSGYAETRNTSYVNADLYKHYDLCIMMGAEYRINNFLSINTRFERGTIYIFNIPGELNYNASILTGIKFFPFN